MKANTSQPRRSFRHSLALLTCAALVLGAAVADARGLVVGRAGRGFVAVHPGYHHYPYHGYGYGYRGYGYGWGYNNLNVTVNVPTSNPDSPYPPGTLMTLPAGSAPVVVFGKTYFFVNGTYYSPQKIAGRVVFVPANP